MAGDIKKVSVYEFGAINNNDALELSSMKGTMRTAATAPTALNKQTMAARCEAASMMMQFILLFQRNVTASLRNSVSFIIYLFIYLLFTTNIALISCLHKLNFALLPVSYICPDFCSHIYCINIWLFVHKCGIKRNYCIWKLCIFIWNNIVNCLYGQNGCCDVL